MPNFYEATPGSHTPSAALSDALLWLSRTPSGMCDVLLLTLPGRLHRQQEQSLFDECYRVLADNGSLFIWGSAAGLLGSRFEMQLVFGDLTHAWSGWDRPALNQDVPLPAFGTLSREMPPSVMEYCVRAAAGPGRLVLDVFPRAPHISQGISAQLGARVLSVAPVADLLYTSEHTAAPAWVHDKVFANDFWKYLKTQGNCLIYPSAQHASGYARLRIGGVEFYAHHVAWMLSHRRTIPQGVPILHASCPDRRCCAPTHLRLGSVAVNLDERWLGKRSASA